MASRGESSEVKGVLADFLLFLDVSALAARGNGGARLPANIAAGHMTQAQVT